VDTTSGPLLATLVTSSFTGSNIITMATPIVGAVAGVLLVVAVVPRWGLSMASRLASAFKHH
jgi:hypothetical protein